MVDMVQNNFTQNNLKTFCAISDCSCSGNTKEIRNYVRHIWLLTITRKLRRNYGCRNYEFHYARTLLASGRSRGVVNA